MSDSGPNNSKASLVAGLLKDPDSLVKVATLAFVIIGGGGNLFATNQAAQINQAEVNLAITEVHQLHAELAASLERQKEMYIMLQRLAPK